MLVDPLFSVGVTTYRRPDLLQETLRSLLLQTEPNFEVLVGNDDPMTPLSKAALGLDDPRLLIINQDRNLGERLNMNSLLLRSRGRYFTWLADDDLVHPRFLEIMARLVRDFESPDALFSNFIRFVEKPGAENHGLENSLAQLLTGEEFLTGYLTGEYRAMGHNGVYSVGFLRELGGLQQLCEAPIAVFTEYLLLLETAALPRVLYFDAPLVYFRVNSSSYTDSTLMREHWLVAARELLCRAIPILEHRIPKSSFVRTVRGLVAIIATDLPRRRRSRNQRGLFIQLADSIENILFVLSLEKVIISALTTYSLWEWRMGVVTGLAQAYGAKIRRRVTELITSNCRAR